MDHWQEAHVEMAAIVDRIPDRHALKLHLARLLERLEQRVALDDFRRPPRDLCRTCGQGVEP